MQQTVNWGILGASNFALQHMARAIHAAANAKLLAVASASTNRVALFQQQFPGIQIHNDYDALLADNSVDAVYIPLPNHLHVEWVGKALDAGKPVLCEKPIALQASDINALIAKRDATGLLAAEAYMIVHHPQWQRAKALFEEGVLGELLHVDGVFSYFNNDMANIRNRPETGGGGIRDIGVYTYGSAMYVTNQEPQQITHTNIRWDNDVDTYAHVLADFPEFSYSGLTSTRAAPRQEMVFHGDKGVMKLSAPFNAEHFAEPKVEVYRKNFVDIVERFPGANQYVNQVENFGRALTEGQSYPWTLEQAKMTQRMIDMVFAASGKS